MERILINGLELMLRPAEERDIGFVYELMRHHLEDSFNQIPEKWSRKKFKEGYKPDRITIIEHANRQIGFFDIEVLDNQLYFHNLHIFGDYQGRGIGTYLLRYIECGAKKHGASSIRGKVFKSNSKLLNHLLRRRGYIIVEELPEEKSFLVKKDLER